ncbi:replication factor A protein 2 [Modicella reniformis]|uniref:Replication factor A protein 2 n=1 Tax=Modicella reniformis TaxID=1440133 RepID=A0A9P6SNI4_9FUNG|nr:replication factor A protein 2 [Modicella reniformis]
MSSYNRSQGQGYVTDNFSSDAGAAKKIVNHTLRPVTIKQLLSVTQTHSDGDFKIDGRDLAQVTFIAVVRSNNRQSTQHTYVVEDGTGSIEARRFPSDDDDSADSNIIVDGTYVRVVGSLRQFNGKFTINVHAIRPIHDMNELTYHILEVMYVHVTLTREKDDGAAMGGMSSASHSNYRDHNMTGAGSVGSGADGTLQQQVVDMIQSHPASKTTGVHRRDIGSRFAPVIGGHESVNALLRDMLDNGFLYTGDDDDHFLTF